VARTQAGSVGARPIVRMPLEQHDQEAGQRLRVGGLLGVSLDQRADGGQRRAGRGQPLDDGAVARVWR
jgi:hypothetical protein